ncbi:MAG: hypothetical protein UR60_C0016G0008 [Candidatus Moranbacteria bacterium GW2011_GWF2_34_56]|nr:MAG: hypothetical protein UR60_C0016G0008 [Candidatus Moranbacteria bacterium GW2011_GWF2_34_56]
MEQNKKILKFNKENFNFTKIKESTFEFFLNHSELLFMLFFLIMSIFSSVLIYKYIYSSVWDEDRKRAYLENLKSGETDFKLNDFNVVVEKSKEREMIYNRDISENVRDIFDIKK